MAELQKINNILSAFKIKATCVEVKEHKNYSSYYLSLFPGGRINSIEKIFTELSLGLNKHSKPITNLIPEDNLIKLDFVNKRDKRLDLESILTKKSSKGKLPCIIGEDLLGNNLWMDLSKNPHMIISGCTGSGKSTAIHTIIANLYNYTKSKIYLVDPKKIEFSIYSSFNNTKVYNTFDQTISLLDKLIDTMELRYSKLDKKYDPIVLIIDEFSDLIFQDSNNEFYNKLCILSQKCRAADIYIILSTQRPSYKIIDGNIKANFPVRMAFKASSKIDSRIILDENGAESLLGNGDGLIKFIDNRIIRFQSAYITPERVKQLFSRYY